MGEEVKNLYVHFPFCRRKCTYCALYSRAGRGPEELSRYCDAVARSIRALDPHARFSTVYFGGGSPGLCRLDGVFDAVQPHLAPDAEFTVELHPLDVTKERLSDLRQGGVNRISIGVQSFDDGVLSAMGRGYSFSQAERAVLEARSAFDNVGIDLIAGYPGAPEGNDPCDARIEGWDLRHVSVYSLIVEENSVLGKKAARGEVRIPGDAETMDRIAACSRFLRSLGFVRYEISNYAKPGYECRHNMAVWRGEDYTGIGEGAHGRMGLLRTENWWPLDPGIAGLRPPSAETVDPARDGTERAIFRLRTSEGIDARGRPGWIAALDRAEAEGLVSRKGTVYTLTERGMEVCDSVMSDLV